MYVQVVRHYSELSTDVDLDQYVVPEERTLGKLDLPVTAELRLPRTSWQRRSN